MGNFYGTPKRFVDEAMDQGRDVILDIEIQGAPSRCAANGRTRCASSSPRPAGRSWSAALPSGGTDSPDKIQKRLLRAKVEFQTAHTYDYFVINDTVEDAVEELNAIMTAEHCKPRERMKIISEA